MEARQNDVINKNNSNTFYSQKTSGYSAYF